MKLEQEDKLNKSQIVSPVEQKSEIKHIKTIRRIHGIHLWKLDLKTNEITNVEPEKTDVSFADAQKGIITTASKVKFEQGCLYCQALNRKNAVKKFGKMINRILEK